MAGDPATAQERAYALLKENTASKQWVQDQRGEPYFVVKGQLTQLNYAFNMGPFASHKPQSMWVDAEKTRHELMHFCVGLSGDGGPYPTGDRLLGLALRIQHDEAKFLYKANWFGHCYCKRCRKIRAGLELGLVTGFAWLRIKRKWRQLNYVVKREAWAWKKVLEHKLQRKK